MISRFYSKSGKCLSINSELLSKPIKALKAGIQKTLIYVPHFILIVQQFTHKTAVTAGTRYSLDSMEGIKSTLLP